MPATTLATTETDWKNSLSLLLVSGYIILRHHRVYLFVAVSQLFGSSFASPLAWRAVRDTIINDT